MSSFILKLYWIGVVGILNLDMQIVSLFEILLLSKLSSQHILVCKLVFEQVKALNWREQICVRELYKNCSNPWEAFKSICVVSWLFELLYCPITCRTWLGLLNWIKTEKPNILRLSVKCTKNDSAARGAVPWIQQQVELYLNQALQNCVLTKPLLNETFNVYEQV